MEPHLQPGTMVVVRPTDPADIEPGMVVTNQLKSGEAAVVTHRVTQSLLTADGERVFITQSDANPSADIDPVRGVQIRETVWYAIPCVGWAPWSFRVRRHSIDELPQLLNVLIGTMSFVGPRPQREAEVILYDDAAERRLLVKPGMSGLWQVSGRSALSWDDALRLDLYYVENWTFTQDLQILFRTVRAVLTPGDAAR